jgi:hypothetical protein
MNDDNPPASYIKRMEDGVSHSNECALIHTLEERGDPLPIDVCEALFNFHLSHVLNL